MKLKKLILITAALLALLVVSGSVQATLMATPTLGDVDCNGEVQANDAALILRSLVDIGELTAQGAINADTNRSGSVEASDASAILRYLVDLDTLPPSQGGMVTPGPTDVPTATPTTPPTAKPTPETNPNLGDVNGDGIITAVDASAILRYLVELDEFDDVQRVNGDTNQNGFVDAADASCILRYLVELDTIPPSTPRPTVMPTASPTPVPTNAAGLPAVGDSGLVVPDDDPNYERIMEYYLNGRLWTDEDPVNASESNTKCDQEWEWQKPRQTDNNNKDIIGWVRMQFEGKTNKSSSGGYAPQIGIDGTYFIDEPIMYRAPNYYYDHKSYGQESQGGALTTFLNSRTKNIVVTGHNSRATQRRMHFYHLHTMQNGLKHLERNSNIDATDYIFNISIYGRYQWQLWALYETPPNEQDSTLSNNTHPSCGVNGVQAWIDYQLTRSEIDMGIEVSPNAQFLTFYTCGDEYEEDNDTNQARLYAFFILVEND